MKAHNLPNEIFLQIFKLLTRETVYQCIYACKVLKAAALEQFYQQVSITVKFSTKLKSILLPNNNSSTTEDNKVTHGELIKTLTFEHDYIVQLTQDELSSLLSYMPSLKRINLSNS